MVILFGYVQISFCSSKLSWILYHGLGEKWCFVVSSIYQVAYVVLSFFFHFSLQGCAHHVCQMLNFNCVSNPRETRKCVLSSIANECMYYIGIKSTFILDNPLSSILAQNLLRITCMSKSPNISCVMWIGRLYVHHMSLCSIHFWWDGGSQVLQREDDTE